MIEEIEMIEVVYPEFYEEEYMNFNLQPVFFGSALNNFGVKELLDAFIDIAPQPQAKEADIRIVEPFEEQFTGFVFKIHANMDPKHRDRSEEHTSELQSRGHLVCRLLLEKTNRS